MFWMPVTAARTPHPTTPDAHLLSGLYSHPSLLLPCAPTTRVCCSSPAWQTFFNERFGLGGTDLAVTSYPYVCAALSGGACGLLADRLIKRPRRLLPDKRRVRKAMTAMGFGVGSLLVLLAARARTPFAAVGTLSLAFLALNFNVAGFEANKLDLCGPQTAGLFQAASNTVASGASIVSIPLAVLVKERAAGGWEAVLVMIALVFASGAAVYVTFAQTHRALP
jgi:hypothetical protein